MIAIPTGLAVPIEKSIHVPDERCGNVEQDSTSSGITFKMEFVRW